MSNINNIEIERKFLVRDTSYREMASRRVHIRQAYLTLASNCSVRIRQWDEQAFLTIKSRPIKGGFSRYEIEKEVTLAEANQLFEMALPGSIDKYRYIVPLQGSSLVAEVDEFLGDNEGLVVAEIELESEQQTYPVPAFLGKEVTFDPRYLNSYLSTHPYKLWK